MQRLLIAFLVVFYFCVTSLNAAYPTQISFSGYLWSVKKSNGRVGPGPNYFSDVSQSVWVDSSGRLHMTIRKQKGKWICSEVISNQSFGYGTYRFYLDSRVDNLDRNAVLGLFTWSDRADYNHREMDIEFSRWADANNQNAQYVVQPYTVAQNIRRFEWAAGILSSLHSFQWQNGNVTFRSIRGQTLPPAPADVVQEWTMQSPGVPVPGDENARINLWLFRGRPPSNGQAVEVIVNRFEFVPSN